MKICLITGSWPPAVCGVSDAMILFGRRLTDDPKNDLSVITTRGYRNHADERKNLRVFDIVRGWGFGDRKAILNKVREIAPDIVHIQYPTKEYGKKLFVNFLPFFLKLAGYRVIITVHEYSFNLSWKGRVRLWPSIFWADQVLVADPVYIRHMHRVFPGKKIDLISIAPNIPPSRLTAGGKAKLRKNYAGDGKTVLLGFFGFLNRNKIVLPVLDAMSKIRETTGRNVKFLMIGEIDMKSPEGAELDREIMRLGLEKQVIMTGSLNDCGIADHLAVLDFAVLLYSSGLSPRNATFLAALDQNIKVITTFTGKKPPSRQNAFFVEVGPREKMANELEKVIEKNLDKKARPNRSSFFGKGWKEYSDSHLLFYKKTIGGRPS